MLGYQIMNPIVPIDVLDSADLTDELRYKALKRAAALLRELDQIRRTLELPIEQMTLVREVYGRAAAAVLEESRRPEVTHNAPMQVRSEDRCGQPMKLKPGLVGMAIARPQCCAYRVEEIDIQGDRSRWLVHDIKVGNRSQFMKAQALPGTDFAPGKIGSMVKFETLQTAMDFAMIVEYVGPEPEGEVFEATCLSTAAGF